MKKLATRLATMSLFSLVLLALSPSLRVQGQKQRKPDENQQKQPAQAVEQQPTTEQARAHLQQRMGERLKSRDRTLRNGWHSVYVTQRGTNYYAFVRGGRVVDTAFGSAKLGEILKYRLPNGLNVAPRPPGAVAQDGGDGPTEEECIKKLIDCIFGDNLSIYQAIKSFRDLLTVDFAGLEADADKAKADQYKCLGAKCKQLLGLD